MTVSLTSLADSVDGSTVIGDPAAVVSTLVADVTHDSRAVTSGALFCCVPGGHVDGHRFAQAAVTAGAVALLVQRRLPAVAVPQILVGDVRAALGPLAAAFWGHPSKKLRLVGVTGTNGKTTVSHIIAALFRAAGYETRVAGTLSGARTTPEATDLQRQLATWVTEGVAVAAIEVSSHALALGRVDATHFALGVFTNLTRDHLDFHGTMEAYFAAKARLFDRDRTEVAVVNLDDPRGRLLRDAAEIRTLGYSLNEASDVTFAATGTDFVWRGQMLHVPLAGRHNLSNALAALTVAAESGVASEHWAAGLAALDSVPGRFESVGVGAPFSIVVDYAHTPDALESVLRAARDLAGADHSVGVVFGCGGDRDATKRPLMGAAADELADWAIVTSDNPRSENPDAIIDAIVAGSLAGPNSGARVSVEADRRAAIAQALRRGAPGDVVIIAGKGHETTQTIGNTVTLFDDRTVVAEEFARNQSLTASKDGKNL